MKGGWKLRAVYIIVDNAFRKTLIVADSIADAEKKHRELTTKGNVVKYFPPTSISIDKHVWVKDEETEETGL